MAARGQRHGDADNLRFLCRHDEICHPAVAEKGILLKDLTPRDIQDFYTLQLERVSANTVLHYHAIIHRALKYAAKMDMIPANTAIRIERPKKDKFVGSFYDSHKVNELFFHLEGHPLELPILQETLKRYPKEISKEQLCKLCHISKRAAKYYLDNGVIPCRCNGQATHKYTIRTRDAITFLRRRDTCPDAFRVTIRSGKARPFVHPSIAYTQRVMQRYQRLLEELAWPYPDLMTVQMIAELTGYSVKTVRRWTAFGHIRWFQNGLKHLAPKELVIRHMMSEDFRTIANKSWKHDKIIQQLIDATNKEDKNHV